MPRIRKIGPVTFSFIVPTHREDRPLHRCLKSVFGQLGAGDEVIVVGDTHDGPLPQVEWLVGEANDQHPHATFRYVEYDAGHHCWGHCQVAYALQAARGTHIHCNDDDDVWADGAVDRMRLAAEQNPGKALLFRFKSYVGGQIFWVSEGRFERNLIGGHCLVLPNVPGKLGRFTCEYNGDFDFLESSVNAFGGPGEAIWINEIVAVARP